MPPLTPFLTPLLITLLVPLPVYAPGGASSSAPHVTLQLHHSATLADATAAARAAMVAELCTVDGGEADAQEGEAEAKAGVEAEAEAEAVAVKEAVAEGVVPKAKGVPVQSVGAFIGSVPIERARIRRFTPHLGRSV